MSKFVCKQREGDEFYTDEKCFIIETSNSSKDSEVSIARARVEAGVITNWHRLKGTAERYAIIGGTGRVEVGDEPAIDVGPGDVVVIPSMTAQRIQNIGDDDLVFFAICTPPFKNEVYEDIEHLFPG